MKITDDKRKYLDCLSEIIKQKYTQDFPDGVNLKGTRKVLSKEQYSECADDNSQHAFFLL